MLSPVLEDGRDGSGEGARDDEPDDGELRRFSKDRMVDLDGKRRKLFFWPDMLVGSKCCSTEYSRLFVPYPGPFYKYGLAELVELELLSGYCNLKILTGRQFLSSLKSSD